MTSRQQLGARQLAQAALARRRRARGCRPGWRWTRRARRRRPAGTLAASWPTATRHARRRARARARRPCRCGPSPSPRRRAPGATSGQAAHARPADPDECRRRRSGRSSLRPRTLDDATRSSPLGVVRTSRLHRALPTALCVLAAISSRSCSRSSRSGAAAQPRARGRRAARRDRGPRRTRERRRGRRHRRQAPGSPSSASTSRAQPLPRRARRRARRRRRPRPPSSARWRPGGRRRRAGTGTRIAGRPWAATSKIEPPGAGDDEVGRGERLPEGHDVAAQVVAAGRRLAQPRAQRGVVARAAGVQDAERRAGERRRRPPR